MIVLPPRSTVTRLFAVLVIVHAALSAARALDLELPDGRRLVLDLSAKWTAERVEQDGMTAFKLELVSDTEVLRCNLVPHTAAGESNTESFQRDRLITTIHDLGGDVTPEEITTFNLPDGVVFFAAHLARHERVITPTMIGDGTVLRKTGDIVRFTIIPWSELSEARWELLTALRNIRWVGERRPGTELSPSDIMRTIKVMVSFRVQPDGSVGDLYVAESDDAAFNDQALAIVRERKFPSTAIGRRMVQPVVFNVRQTGSSDHADAPASAPDKTE